jgi:hypothetical protein
VSPGGDSAAGLDGWGTRLEYAFDVIRSALERATENA